MEFRATHHVTLPRRRRGSAPIAEEMLEAAPILSLALLSSYGDQTAARVRGVRIPSCRPVLEHLLLTGRTEHPPFGDEVVGQFGSVDDNAVCVKPEGAATDRGNVRR